MALFNLQLCAPPCHQFLLPNNTGGLDLTYAISGQSVAAGIIPHEFDKWSWNGSFLSGDIESRGAFIAKATLPCQEAVLASNKCLAMSRAQVFVMQP